MGWETACISGIRYLEQIIKTQSTVQEDVSLGKNNWFEVLVLQFKIEKLAKFMESSFCLSLKKVYIYNC